MRRSRRGGGFHQEFGGSGEDSFVAVVVTKLTGALLFILLLTMVIMALIPKADSDVAQVESEPARAPKLVLEVPETLPEAVVGRPYAYAFSVRGDSTGPLAWSIRDPLPEGVVFDAAAGRLTGSVASDEPASHLLTIQVTDGRTVAGAVTRLPVWNPEKKVSPADNSVGYGSPLDKSLEGWVSQGFGLGLIWFGHFAGVGLIDKLQRREDAEVEAETLSTRFAWYRRTVWLLSLSFTSAIVYWMVMIRG
jgi:preprotein translocase subunit SecG